MLSSIKWFSTHSIKLNFLTFIYIKIFYLFYLLSLTFLINREIFYYFFIFFIMIISWNINIKQLAISCEIRNKSIGFKCLLLKWLKRIARFILKIFTSGKHTYNPAAFYLILFWFWFKYYFHIICPIYFNKSTF